MRILIDIGHPGHVHLFRPFAQEMEKKGHKILFTYRQKEFERELLNDAGFRNQSFGKHYNTTKGKIWGLFKFNFLMLLTILHFRPKILLSHGSIYAAQMAWLTGRPHISLEDSGNMEQIRLYRPFTKAILTPDVLPEKLGGKQIKYAGYHELAYLHPNYFKPDVDIVNQLGFFNAKPYCLLRFVSWKATHDYGHKGFSATQKEELINFLSQHYNLVISSEAVLPDHLTKYQMKLHPALLHHVLAFAKLVISEGATIASEAGVLGVPTIYVNSIARSYNEDQEKYGTVFNFRSGDEVMTKVQQLLNTSGLGEKSKINRQNLLQTKIDVTAFLTWFIENYPESFRTMKETPDYQYRFE